MKKNSVKKNITNTVFQFSLIGFGVGTAIAVVAYIFALKESDLIFTLGNIVKLNADYPHLLIVTLLPVVFIIVGWIAGKYTYRVAEKLYDLETYKDNSQKKLFNFAEELSKGNLNSEYEPEKGNALGNIMIELRDNLQHNKQEEMKRKEEDEQRNWTAGGLAKFGEILRNNNNDVNQLAFEVISQLSEYIGAVQGGFFILNDEIAEDSHFELIAHFAYGRKKFSQKRVELSEGLVGRAAYEKNTIYLDEVPEEYIEVTSGLGEANPRVLLIVPLKVNDEIHGVLELSSFHPFAEYVISFVEKVAESIATTISTVKINMRTTKLLADSQEQADRLSQQEEEMRQNMEELQATQEEATKQAEEFISFNNSVNHTMMRAEFDLNGILVYANLKFLKKMGYSSNSDVDGHHISMFISEKNRHQFNEIWDELVKGGHHYEGYMKLLTKSGHDIWTLSTFSCVRDSMQTVVKILLLAMDTTEQQEKNIDFENKIKAVNNSNIVIDYAPSGRLVDCNQMFIDTIGYSKDELKDYSVFNFVVDKEQNEFETTWNNIIAGQSYRGLSRLTTSGGEVKWLDVAYTPVMNEKDEISKVVAIANDITAQKNMETIIQQQNEQIKKQEQALKDSEADLETKLAEARREVKAQYQEIEKVKVRNEKTLEGAHDAIVTINQSGDVEFFNRAAETLWGYSRTEVLGKNIKMLFREYTADEDEFMTNLLHPEKRKFVGVRKETTIHAKDGAERPVIMLLAGAKVQNEYTYTAFIQSVEAE
ncbi:MAG: PAS domain S-box protein [Salinivirgaceae bacterium]|nr:PAS domain S-box protein [Salinivirgaceae bacterium]MBR3567287.1 PAS domain S-box protein [Salinivirgaceae bacterium]MBR4620478.1 PAS domain S-box protein [Salinivirgaceae bacterium]